MLKVNKVGCQYAVIQGDLINFSGNIEINGKVMGMIRSNSGKMSVNDLVEANHLVKEFTRANVYV